jgi:hypothetical protein
MRDFLIEQDNQLVARPNRFLIPIAQLSDRFIIPNSTVVVIMEYRPGPHDRNRARAWRLGRALCCAGVPVFDKGGRIRIYCPCAGIDTVYDAFQFHKESILPDARQLRDYAEHDDFERIADIVGEVSCKLDKDAIVIDGARRQGTTFRTFTQQYLLPEGATLL